MELGALLVEPHIFINQISSKTPLCAFDKTAGFLAREQSAVEQGLNFETENGRLFGGLGLGGLVD